MKRITIPLVTAADGSATIFSGHTRGKVHSVTYIKPGDNPLADTVDMTITVEDTGEAVLSVSNVAASFTKYPRAAVHDVTGAAALLADAGKPVLDRIGLATDRLKIVLAQGGNAKVGTLIVTMDND